MAPRIASIDPKFKYAHEVVIYCDGNDYDDPNRESLIFHSVEPEFDKLKENIKAAVKEWLASGEKEDTDNLKQALDCYGDGDLDEYYREGIDPPMTEEEMDENDVKPISELEITWRMVYVYLPLHIAEKHGFTTIMSSCNDEDEYENFN